MYQESSYQYNVKEPSRNYIVGAVLAGGILGYMASRIFDGGGSHGGHLHPPTIDDKVH